ncbi:MAG: TPM domain-containing protein [Ignavibacteria bacterium]|nr:TPM domain-containing protein [Ignavibacteria bacterium]
MHSIFYDIMNDDDLLRISNAITEMEKLSSGEIVVSIKEKRNWWQKRVPVRKLAEREFRRLKINATRDHTGILLYIILKDREFSVLADSGIHDIVGDSQWELIKDLLLKNFRAGYYCKGIVEAVHEMGRVLSLHFPIKPDDTNEISNRVIIRP